MEFRTQFGQDVFNNKYSHDGTMTYNQLAKVLVEEVTAADMPMDEVKQLTEYVTDMKFVPGGRYLYYAGRDLHAYNNCFLLKAEEDTREDWAELSKKVELCLTTGGGIGVDYTTYRPRGTRLSRTGGTASGSVSKMRMIDSMGTEIMQGGSRRSAIYASLNHAHGDIDEFLRTGWTCLSREQVHQCLMLR